MGVCGVWARTWGAEGAWQLLGTGVGPEPPSPAYFPAPERELQDAVHSPMSSGLWPLVLRQLSEEIPQYFKQCPHQ
jgi:hypothetical protein